MRAATRLAAVLAALLVTACGGGGGGGAGTGTGTGDQAQPGGAPPRLGEVQVVATGLQVPWGLAWLPNGDALVSERTTGRILRIPKGGGKPQVAMNLPQVDRNIGEGGLLGIAVSPDYARDRLVYAYYTGTTDNRVVRFRLGSTQRPLITGIYRSTNHDGGRIAFGPDGKLYVTTGDGLEGSRAQDLSSPNGKILRINPDGSIPSDNPWPGSPVWSLGHRNVQGLAWDDQGRLWATEFGENRKDEINLIRKGANYGWPAVEGVGDTRGGRFTNPKLTWDVAEASPSGVAYAKGNLWVGALRGQRLWRVPLDGTRVGTPQALLEGEYGRIRTVALGPDGALWLTTSNRDGRGSPAPEDDRLLRVPLR